MAEEDVVIRLEDGGSGSGDGANDPLDDLRKAAGLTADELERLQRQAKAEMQNRSPGGRFAPGYRRPYPYKRRGPRGRRGPSGGSGGGGGDGGDGGGGDGGGGDGGDAFITPPEGDGSNRKPFQFRIEGLANLLKGGANIRLRGIQQFTEQNIMDLFERLKQRAETARRTATGSTTDRMLGQGLGVIQGIQRAAGVAIKGLSRLGPTGVVIAGVIAGFTFLAFAAFKLRKAFNNLTEEMKRDVGVFSPQLAIAEAQANISDMQSRFEAAQRTGGALAGQTTANQFLANEVREFKATMVNMVAIPLQIITYLLGALMWIVNQFFAFFEKIKDVVMKVFEWLAFLSGTEFRRDKEEDEWKGFNNNIINKLMDSANTDIDGGRF